MVAAFPLKLRKQAAYRHKGGPIMRNTRIILITIITCALFAGASAAQVAGTMDAQDDGVHRTPPRLSLLDGSVSFWRPGAEDWVQARINTALAPGDQLYIGPEGQVELQIGAGAFMRGSEETQIGLIQHEWDFIQFKVTMGRASLDLRALDPGITVAVDTPNAAFTMHHEGYYRLEVNDTHTTIITHGGAQASAVLANGDTVPIAPNEAVTIAGTDRPAVTAEPAPALDRWDTWNQARTDRHMNAESARYASPGIYGLGDLDKHGAWRTVPTYGRVWVPHAVPAGWAPYSTGTWIRDPYYGWTWVDSAPWGWAPYHYGRWVFVNSVWCWAPGPIVARPVYAPALVAFYGQPGVSVSVSIGGPVVGWVALGWGEPLIPWWGRPGFIHRPWWGGWGGPRVINNVTVHRTTVVNVRNITHYRNARVRNAIVTVDKGHFGRGPIPRTRVTGTQAHRLRPLHTAPHVSTRPESFVPTTARGMRPPEDSLRRSVVSSRTRVPSHGPGASTGLRSTPRPTVERAAPPQRTQPTMRRTSPALRDGAPETRPQIDERRRAPSQRSATGSAAQAPSRIERRTATPAPGIRPARPDNQRPAITPRPQAVSPPSVQRPERPRNDAAVRSPARSPAPAPSGGVRQDPTRLQRRTPSEAPASMVAPSWGPSGRSDRPREVMRPRSGGGRSEGSTFRRGDGGFSGRSR